MTQEKLVHLLQNKADRLRIHSIRSTTEAGSGHPTSCMSAADLVATLFFHVMRYDPQNPDHADNDRFILSKGHAAPVLYAAWAEAGVIPGEKLLTLRRIDSELEGTRRLVGNGSRLQPVRWDKDYRLGLEWH